MKIIDRELEYYKHEKRFQDNNREHLIKMLVQQDEQMELMREQFISDTVEIQMDSDMEIKRLQDEITEFQSDLLTAQL